MHKDKAAPKHVSPEVLEDNATSEMGLFSHLWTDEEADKFSSQFMFERSSARPNLSWPIGALGTPFLLLGGEEGVTAHPYSLQDHLWEPRLSVIAIRESPAKLYSSLLPILAEQFRSLSRETKSEHEVLPPDASDELDRLREENHTLRVLLEEFAPHRTLLRFASGTTVFLLGCALIYLLTGFAIVQPFWNALLLFASSSFVGIGVLQARQAATATTTAENDVTSP